jgi:hypothetical protein
VINAAIQCSIIYRFGEAERLEKKFLVYFEVLTVSKPEGTENPIALSTEIHFTK